MLAGYLLIMAGHFLADYALQRTRLGAYKRQNLLGLALHALTWAALLSPGLFLCQRLDTGNFVFLFLSHLVIDFCKNRAAARWRVGYPAVNLADQLLHLWTVLMVLFW